MSFTPTDPEDDVTWFDEDEWEKLNAGIVGAYAAAATAEATAVIGLAAHVDTGTEPHPHGQYLLATTVGTSVAPLVGGLVPSSMLPELSGGTPTLSSDDLMELALLATQARGPRRDKTKPAGAIDLSPGTSTATRQAIITAAPVGAKFWELPGIYRETADLIFKQNQELHGAYDSVHFGSKLLGTTTESAVVVLGTTTQANAGTHWALDPGNARYYIGAQTAAQVSYPGTAAIPSVDSESQTGYRADTNQEMFRDGLRLKHHDTLANLATGGAFFDFAADRWYVKDDPTGHKMTSSGNGFSYFSIVNNSGVKFYNVTAQQFGNYAQNGAVRGFGADTLLENCDFSYNHGLGFTLNGSGSIARWCRTNYNGQLGWGVSSQGVDGSNDYVGRAQNVLIENCEAGWNNDARFKEGWEGGATKHSSTTGLRVRLCWVHDNRGVGLWTDTNNYLTLLERNLVEDTGDAEIFGGLLGRTTEGITSEVNYSTIIRYNLIRHVGKVPTAGWANGGAIVVAGSADHDVYGNVEIDCARAWTALDQGRIDGAPAPSQLMRFVTTPTAGKWYVARNRWHHNTAYVPVATIDENFAVGVVQDANSTLFSDAAFDNRFYANVYYINLGAMPKPFAWNSPTEPDRLTFAQWQAYGHDRDGQLVDWRPVGTGFVAATGTATKGAFLTSTVTLPQLAEQVKAIKDFLLAAGMVIG